MLAVDFFSPLGRYDFAVMTFSGSPFNLGQAQSHLSSGPLGPHISWVQSDPLSFLSASSSSSPPTPSTPLYSSAILAHSIYYLSAPTVLHSQLLALKRAGITHLFLAEYALCSRSSALGFPHVLAVLSQAVHPDSVGNVRSVLSPSAIKAMARQAGWRLCAETILTNPEVDDGKWEVGAALEMEREDEAGVAQAHRDALRASLPPGGVKEVKTMDVWTAVFEADDTP